MQISYGRLRDDRAVVVEAALGSSSSKSSYYYSHSANKITGSRSLYSHHPSAETAIEVQVLSLEKLAQEHAITTINLMKIDVEGGELEVLRGSEELLRIGAIDYIMLEYSHLWLSAGASLSQLITMISSWDYDLYQVYPSTLRSVPAWHPSLDSFGLMNYLLVRKSLPLPLPCSRMALPYLGSSF